MSLCEKEEHRPIATRRKRRDWAGTVNDSKVRSRPDQAPACWKSGSKRGTNENVIVQIPDRCLTRARIIKHIVWLAVAIKIGCSYQNPARWKSGSKRTANENVIVEVPDRCLTTGGVKQSIIWM